MEPNDWLRYTSFPELNRVLLIAKQLGAEEEPIEVAHLIEACQGIVRGGGLQDHRFNIDVAEKIGLLQPQRNLLKIASFGLEFLQGNPLSLYDITPEQISILLHHFFVFGPASDQSRRLLNLFIYDESRDAYVFKKGRGVIPSELEPIFVSLQKLGAISASKGSWILSPEASLLRDLNVLGPSLLTPSQLDAIIKRKRDRGSDAEAIAMEFEKTRLRSQGDAMRASLVHQVSELSTVAGYDIASFSTESTTYDRLIEVKAVTISNPRFYITRGEIIKALKEEDKYWIYFVDPQFSSEPTLILLPAPHCWLPKSLLDELSSPLGKVISTDWQIEPKAILPILSSSRGWTKLERFRYIVVSFEDILLEE